MEQLTFIRFAALAAFLLGFGASGYVRRKADLNSGKIDRKAEQPLIRTLLQLFGLVFLLGILGSLIYPPLMAWASFAAWPLSLRWLGLVLMLAALPFMLWTLTSLGNNITPTVKTRSSHQLVTSGPYRYIRHPLYTFGATFFIGAMLVTGNWLLMLAAVPGLAALARRTPQEEAMLVERFGDAYRTYMSTTGRYLPRLSK